MKNKYVITFGSNHLSWLHHRLNPMNVALVIEAENENKARSQVFNSRIGERFATSYKYEQYRKSFNHLGMKEYSLNELKGVEDE